MLKTVNNNARGKKQLFGTFAGVFVPSFEAILGAVLFLILPMLTGMMGFWRMAVIIIISNTVTIATAFSISDCATNIERIGAGGMYAVSRRSLGRAFGGSIGIQLFLAQSASIGFYAIGFSEPLQSILLKIPLIDHYIGGFDILVQKQIIATAIATFAFLLGIAGAHFIVKIQMVIFVILIGAVGSIILSPLSGSASVHIFSGNVNLLGFGTAPGFWAAFAAFFPAVTGIDAGVGMSGSLENPKKSLSSGTFIAIGITFFIYLAVTGIYSLIKPELLAVSADGQIPSVVDVFSGIPVIAVLLLTGILVATGSSALSYFMTAPRTAQALAQDRILPKILNFLSGDFKKQGKEPRWAAVLVYLIILPVIWSGDITRASMVVGICFLIVYGWVNFAAFLERISGNPSFRPVSRGHWAISLYGFVVCMAVIALFNIWVGLGVAVSQTIIFILLLKYKSQNKLEGVWWGVLFSGINWGFKHMNRIVQGTKNWRPIVSAFSFGDRKDMVMHNIDMGERIARYQGLVMHNIIKTSNPESNSLELPVPSNLIEAPDDDYDLSIMSIIQSALPGGFRINTALLPVDVRLNYIEIIEKLIRMEVNILLYKHGKKRTESKRIDVWWKGEENGNLMAMLAYIISRADIKTGRTETTIRIIRKTGKADDRNKSGEEMYELLRRARLSGEVLIIQDDDKPIRENMVKYSSDAMLILMGIPGEKKGGLARLFSLDRLFFTRELEKFEDFPSMLFVKASRIFDLVEE